MKKYWFLILLGVILACGPTDAQLRAQTSLPSIPEEPKPQAKIQCKIVVKRFRVSEQSYEPVVESEVIIVDNKAGLPTPADYIVVGSMSVEAGNECKVIEIVDAIKTGAGDVGANYVLPWEVQTRFESKEWGTEIEKHKWIKQKTMSTYILLRKKKLSI